MPELIDITEVDIINKRLEEMYGRHTVVNKPRFRVVWTTNQTEKRYGTFNVYCGDIFLREETGIREVEKYPFFPNCWAVERLHENKFDDVISEQYDYMALFTFPEGLPLNWRAVELVVKNALKLLSVDRDEQIPHTEKEMLDREQKRLDKEKKETRDLIDTTALETSLNDGSAISYVNKEGIDYRPSKLVGGTSNG